VKKREEGQKEDDRFTIEEAKEEQQPEPKRSVAIDQHQED
jgi:hypothetical protein